MQIPRSSSRLISFAFMIATLFALQLASAAECTADDLLEIQQIYASATSSSSGVCSDETMKPNYCDDTTCLAFMADLVNTLPGCTTSGVSVKERVTSALEYCDGLAGGTTEASGSSSSTVASDVTAPTSTPSTEDTTADDTTASTSAAPTSTRLDAGALGLAIGAMVSLLAAGL